MQVTIKINMDNEAFSYNNTAEVCRILRGHISKVANGGQLMEGHKDTLIDSNGNSVGYFAVEDLTNDN